MRRKKIYNEIEEIKKIKIDLNNESNPKVLLLYCTYDDFDPSSLLRSMRQNYNNFQTIILDDSKNEKTKQEIDVFAQKYNVKVVRRNNNQGFKAGNLNNFLKNNHDYDYFVILDSDEIIPANFVLESIKYFLYYKNVGIVQGNHVSTRNSNFFMNIFAHGVNSHWETYQNIKNKWGFSFFLGHGAMISKEAYLKSGNGFPEIVAEDLGFSLEVRKKNLYTVFAPHIICEEKFPVNYHSFKIRQIKWTNGSIEFIKKILWKILRPKTPISKIEKIDLFFSSFSIMGSFMSILSFNIFFIFLPLMGHIWIPIWFYIFVSFFIFVPMLNDLYSFLRGMNFLKLIFYLINSFLLYGSMLIISFYSIILALLGKKAKFIVTPKNNKKINIWTILIVNFLELSFAIVLVILAIFYPKSLWININLIILNLSTIYLSFMSNWNYKIEKNDIYVQKQKENYLSP